MKVVSLFLALVILGCSSKENRKESVLKPRFISQPEIAFTVTEGILHPESALYSEAHKAIFVSNVASGNPMETKRVGYISKLSPDGLVIKSKWISGLKAPKGMAVVKNFLFVSDVNEVAKIDIKAEKIVRTWKVKGAKFLNDVVADDSGRVYVSDMNANVIHVIENDQLKDWIRSDELRGPNGLFSDGKEHILMVQWGSDVDPKTWVAKNPGRLSSLSLKAPAIREADSISGHLDGIDSDNEGNLYVSDWMNGDVWYVKKNGAGERIYNFGQGTADISFAKELNLLLVPQMNQNKVMAIKPL